jgi:hypothetical protein
VRTGVGLSIPVLRKKETTAKAVVFLFHLVHGAFFYKKTIKNKIGLAKTKVLLYNK